jgi:ATP-dependent DNA helicase RecG
LEELHEAALESHSDPESFPPLENWLTQENLGRRIGDRWVPNPTAILLFSEDPQDHLPGAFIELVRYAGVDYDAPVSLTKTITGPLTTQLDTAWTQLSVHVANVPAEAVGIRSPFVPEYPIEALKELIRNLVQHRLYEGTHAPARIEWFEDRIELSNPGGPFGRAAEGPFGTHSDYRNPTLTDWLRRLGYVERLGRGIKRVHSLLRQNGNPSLEAETDGFTRVIVRRRT